MKYFTDNFHQFFKNLAANNHKEWFDVNRKMYENEVKKPFAHFVSDLIEYIKKVNPSFELETKNAIFRINRDIRFSKDKTPYKLFASALISQYGRKGIDAPGFYIEFNPEKLSLYSGMYMPKTDQVQKIRTHIMNNNAIFEKIISDKGFKTKFGKIQGEQHKRIPKEFAGFLSEQPLIANKQWYVMVTLPPEELTSEKFMETVMELYKTALPLQQFFETALR
jgi:uncharacterized protein (TIGR02453 family)